MALTGAQAATAALRPASRRRGALAAMLPALVVGAPLVLFVLYPLAHILGRSFSTADGLGLANYATMLGSERFLRITLNSFAVTLLSAALAILLAYPAAWETWAVFIAVLLSLAVTSVLISISAGTSVPRALARTLTIGAVTMALSFAAGVIVF